MKNFYTYGCSWTNSNIHENDLGLILWPEIINKKLKCNLINNAASGRGNLYLIRQLINDLSKFKKDDIIIFQFSYGHRLELPFLDKNEYWSTININRGDKIFDENDKIFDENVEDVYLNFVMRFNSEILLSDFETIKPLFNYLKNTGVIFKYWFIDTGRKDIYVEKKLYDKDMSVVFNSKVYNGLDASMLIELEKCRIMDDNISKFKNDNHPNQKGQNKIAECILKSLNYE